MRSLHEAWLWVAVITNGVAGLWGLALHFTRRPVDRVFKWVTGIAVVAMLLQVAFGLILYSQGWRPANDFHVFYGFVILFAFTFVYIYRIQYERRPALLWGLTLLFVMGLGLRAWANVR